MIESMKALLCTHDKLLTQPHGLFCARCSLSPSKYVPPPPTTHTTHYPPIHPPTHNSELTTLPSVSSPCEFLTCPPQAVMQEVGVDITSHTSDFLHDFSPNHFDAVVSMCG